MKAIIFNSGIGKRMGALTANNPKSMVKLANGETIFERQIRVLSENGIKEFVITSGPYEEQLVAVTKKKAYSDCTFTFVKNPIYDKSNYIYSLYLAKDKLDDDFLMLHGDLVFNGGIVEKILSDKNPSTCLINKKKVLPEKDFKGRICDGKLREVSINIFDDDCFTFQPLYKLDKKTLHAWLDNVSDYIENRGINSVYAENALNEITDRLDIIPISYEDDFVEEIDNEDDYVRVCRDIQPFDAREQKTVGSVAKIGDYLRSHSLKRPLVVISGFLLGSDTAKQIESFSSPVFFSDFKPNPLYEDAIKAKRAYLENGCDSIISIGGGSAIDTAKALKLFLPIEGEECLINKPHVYENIKHIAVPTTAGTGSEATRFSVIYYNGEKQSLTDVSIIPDLVVLDPSFLETLPENQKTATVLDALCQATESIWSVNANEESVRYASEAIDLIIKNVNGYMAGSRSALTPIQIGANLSGKAINITQTTAAHAMSYKLTSLYGIPHGAAVAMAMIPVWECYNLNSDKGSAAKAQIAKAYGTDSAEEAFEMFKDICDSLSLKRTVPSTNDELDILVNGVNPERLKNFPVALTKEAIRALYQQIVEI
ncbi:MAG: iron-containing alcohol dehydrogenase [Clostridia bacterium]|nr:iron-containing alcohol dehydrogenase [Clostridia bacterium]